MDDFSVGENVKVIDGTFEGFEGTIVGLHGQFAEVGIDVYGNRSLVLIALKELQKVEGT